MNPDPTSLDRLHDIVVPPPVPWWPPAPGWYWVLGLLLAVAACLLLRAVIWWQRNRYRREALAELARQERLLSDPKKAAGALASMAELLKRAALSAFPREEIASLTGPAWIAFLDRSGDSDSNAAALMERAAYDPRAAHAFDEADSRKAVTFVRRWLVRHRVRQAGSDVGEGTC